MKNLKGDKTARHELLRNYLLVLIAEGEFDGIKTKASAVVRALAAVGQDVPKVIGELVAATGDPFGATLLNKASELIGDIRKRGLNAVLADIRETYNRGIDVNAQRRSK